MTLIEFIVIYHDNSRCILDLEPRYLAQAEKVARSAKWEGHIKDWVVKP